MRVMLCVTHLLGTGHLARTLTLARAFVAAGHDTHVVSGGRPAPHLDTRGVSMHQLAPVASSGTDFTRLVDAAGAPVGDALLDARAGTLCALLDRLRPDALITELFPFGRRMLRTEFLALAEQARAQRIPCFSSVRDILAPPSSDRKAQFALETVLRFYSAVLVHGDPDIAPLESSWPVTPELRARLVYTGYIAPPPAPPDPSAEGYILVSAGGGPVGTGLFRAALDTARLCPGTRWRFFVGDPALRTDLAHTAPAGAEVTGLSPGFRSQLACARASVSQLGYNTALDLLQTGVPAVVVPFDDGGEVEQSLRARAFSELAGLRVLTSPELSAAALRDALSAVCTGPRRSPGPGALTGAQASVDAVIACLERGR